MRASAFLHSRVLAIATLLLCELVACTPAGVARSGHEAGMDAQVGLDHNVDATARRDAGQSDFEHITDLQQDSTADDNRQVDSNHSDSGLGSDAADAVANECAGDSALPEPAAATIAFPLDCSVGVPIDVNLSWVAGSNAESHRVYFGQVSPGSPQGSCTEVSFDPGPLRANTTYYWRVDETNACGTTTGEVWSFTTGEAPATTGRHVLVEPVLGRRYVLYVPVAYDSRRAYPLVVSSHGTAQNGDTEMDDSGPNNGFDRGTPTWPTLSEQHGIVVICPDMVGAHGQGTELATDQLDELATDELALLSMVTEVQQRVRIDPARRWLTGFSGGGHVMHYVGLRHPEIFSAISARHGNFNVEETPVPLPDAALETAVYLFTGSNDPVYGTDEAIAWYTTRGFGAVDTDEFTSYPSSEHTTDRHHALNWFLAQ